jgi:hypothetical protein
MVDPERKAAREALVAAPAGVGPVARAQHHGRAVRSSRATKASVVDVKLHMAVRWFLRRETSTTSRDHLLRRSPSSWAVHDAVREHPAVKAWYARG